MKRKSVLLFAMLVMLLLPSCHYEVLDFDSVPSDEVVVPPDDGSYEKASIDMVKVVGLDSDESVTAKLALESFPNYMSRFFQDGFLSEICNKIGISLPDVTLRPSRAISASVDIKAVDEVLSIGTPYHDWSEVYLDRLTIKADGNAQNLVGLILHHSDPMTWPKDVPFTGKLELGLKSGIKNGSDKPDEQMPKAYVAARINIELQNVIFSTVVVNGNTIPYPVEGRIKVSRLDGSFASSHLTRRTDWNSEFPSTGEPSYETLYAPFALSLHMEPTRMFNVKDVIYAVEHIIKNNESADSYWSYIVNTCWDKYAGDHIVLDCNTSVDELESADLLLFQMLLQSVTPGRK